MIQEYLEIFKGFLEVQDKFTTGLYLVVAKIVAGVTFVPAAPLTLLSGALLGTFWGTVVAMIGNILGAVLAFLVARYLLRNFVKKTIFTKYPKILNYEKKLFENGFATVVFLRLVPLFPFNVLNLCLAVTEVKFKDYLFGTMVGIIPGTLAFVYFGESLKMLNLYSILFAVLGILGLSYVGKIWKI